MRLLRQIDDAHAAFADLLHQLVGADDRAGAVGETGRLGRNRRRKSWRFEEAGGALVDLEQALDALEQSGIRATSLAEIRPALAGVFLLQGGNEEIAFGHR